MPVPAVIAAAAQSYSMNTDFLNKMVADLTTEEWLRHPAPNPNHIAWIVGHVTWARERLLDRLGTQWSKPWFVLFGRGSKCGDDVTYPSHDTLLDAWKESAFILTSTLESVAEDLLAQPSTQGPPSTDGNVSGVVNFLAIHETYHLGQISYLRGWLGHKGFMG